MSSHTLKNRIRRTALLTLLALGVTPTLASADHARTATVHMGGSVEIALQGPRGEARFVLYPEGVAVTGSTSPHRAPEPAYRHHDGPGHATTYHHESYEHVTSRPVGRAYPPAPAYRRGSARHTHDGRYVAHHACGALAVEGHLRRGQAHGTWRWFDARGRITEERSYRRGILHGTVRIWHANGRLAEEHTYRDGRLHGTMRVWRTNGRLAEERHYHHDRLHGPVRTWHANGRLATERHYRNGSPTGRMMTWNPAGRVMHERRHRS